MFESNARCSLCHVTCWPIIALALDRAVNSCDTSANAAEALLDVLLQASLHVSGSATAAAPALAAIGIAPAELKRLLSSFSDPSSSSRIPVAALSSAAARISRIVSGRPASAPSARDLPVLPTAPSARDLPVLPRPARLSPRALHHPISPTSAAVSSRGYVRSFGGGFRGRVVSNDDNQVFGWSPVSNGVKGRTTGQNERKS